MIFVGLKEHWSTCKSSSVFISFWIVYAQALTHHICFCCVSKCMYGSKITFGYLVLATCFKAHTNLSNCTTVLMNSENDDCSRINQEIHGVVVSASACCQVVQICSVVTSMFTSTTGGMNCGVRGIRRTTQS